MARSPLGAVEKDQDADEHLNVVLPPSQRRDLTDKTSQFDKDKATSLNVMRQVAERGIRPEINNALAPALITLISGCWSNTRMLRPTFNNIVELLDGRIRNEVYSYAENKKMEGEQKIREELDRKKAMISTSRKINREENFSLPVILVRSTEMLRLGRIPVYEEVSERSERACDRKLPNSVRNFSIYGTSTTELAFSTGFFAHCSQPLFKMRRFARRRC